jgi:hypothetical protein
VIDHLVATGIDAALACRVLSLTVRLLRVEEPSALGAVAERRGADGRDRPQPPGLPNQLRGEASACRVAARVADPLREEAGGTADARGRDRGNQSPPQTREGPPVAGTPR